MKIKNLFAVAALLMGSMSAFAQQVISPVTLVDDKGINYNVVRVFVNENIEAGDINTVNVAITNSFASATLEIPDEVTLTLNSGSKDWNGTPIEGKVKFRVIGIVKDAFRNNRNITSVKIGKYVEQIDDDAFNNCIKISKMEFASGSALNKVGDYCFGNTPMLKSIDFDNCAKLTDISTTKPFYTDATHLSNNYLTTLKLNKVKTIGTSLSALPALSSVAFTELIQLDAYAFDGDGALASLELPANCVAIATNALDGSSVNTLTINSLKAKAQAISANVYGTSNNKLSTLTFKGVFGGTIAANAFDGNGLTNVSFAEVDAAANAIAASAIKLKSDASSTITITKISAASFAADAFVGPTAWGCSAALNLGAVAAALSNEMVSNAVGAATTGKITKALDVKVFGSASSISFGEIATGGSIVSTLTGTVSTLTSVTFNEGIVAGGIATGAFKYFNKLATVEFKTNLTAGAVLSGAFGDGTNNAGSANITGTNPYRMFVTYKPTVFTAAFTFDAFNDSWVGPTPTVLLISNMTFVDNSGYFALDDVEISFLGETRTITVSAPEGESTYYGKFVADGCRYKIAKTNKDGKKVVVYEAYVDQNSDSKVSNIVMLPLTLDENYYVVDTRQAVVVRSWGNADIIAEATTEPNTHNYYSWGARKNEIRYYEQGTSYDYLRVSIDASLIQNECLSWGKKYCYGMKNPATSAFEWGLFNEESGLMPPYTFYVFTNFKGSVASGARLNVIWADDADETTAIQKVQTTTEEGDGAIYNLAGQKVGASYKGVVIKNGKKYIK